MKIEKVTLQNQKEFIDYCKQYAGEHDDSYTPDNDFNPETTHPAVLLKDDGEIVGAACLMRTPAFLDAGKARFMIFHSLRKDLEVYKMLWQAIEPATKDLEFTYLFVPEGNQPVRDIWEQIGFRVQRYSYVLSRNLDELAPMDLPDGFAFKSLEETDEAGMQDYARNANICFANLAGHVDSTLEDIRKMFHYSDSIPGGLMLLMHGEKPIGTLNIWDDEEVDGGTFLEGITVLPAYQGRGLGRMTLRKGLHFSKEKGFTCTSLSVNAENENAVNLYLKEGFEKELVVVCYEMR